MNTWAAPGAKCVCVKTGTWRLESGALDTDRPAIFPVRDEIYTVTKVIRVGASVGIELKEIGALFFFNICRFRPLAYPKQSLEHDVSLFKPAHVPAPVVERT